MDALQRAHSTFTSRVEEVVHNTKIRDAFDTLFVRRRDVLFAQVIDQQLRKDLNRTLELGKMADSAVIYRGLLLQLNGAFEVFIAKAVAAVIEARQAKVVRFSQLPESLRVSYTVHSANILAKMHDGHVHGVHYDFAGLQDSVGLCFTDAEKYRLKGEVFTLLLGNCTPKKVTKLFEEVGIGAPFDDEIAKEPTVKKWAQNAGTREVKKRVERKLDEEVKRRNQIAHGSGDVAVLAEEVIEVADFFSALGFALEKKARAAL